MEWLNWLIQGSVICGVICVMLIWRRFEVSNLKEQLRALERHKRDTYHSHLNKVHSADRLWLETKRVQQLEAENWRLKQRLGVNNAS